VRDQVSHPYKTTGKIIILYIEFSWQIFEKCSNIKFNENPYSVSRVVPCGQTDRHDEANSRFSQFFRRAKESVHFALRLDASPFVQ
jgi:hypothetical protein